jgi:hypothetical protein
MIIIKVNSSKAISSSLSIPILIFKLHSADSAVYSAEQRKIVFLGKLWVDYCRWPKDKMKFTRHMKRWFKSISLFYTIEGLMK